MVLLVIDAQIWLTNKDLYCYERFVNGTKKVIEAARENNIEVIYVQHDDGPGTGFSKDDAEFEINQEFYPQEGEKRYIKTVSSAFQGTGLKEYLKDEDTVVVVGLLTNFCMDATIKSAFEMGFKIIIPEGTNTTSSTNFALRAEAAMCKCPICMGLKLPSNIPIFILFRL